MLISIDGKHPPHHHAYSKMDSIRPFALFIAQNLRPDSVISWIDTEGTDVVWNYETLRQIADMYYPNIVPPRPISDFGFVNVSNTEHLIREAIRALFTTIQPKRFGVKFKAIDEGGWTRMAIEDQDGMSVSIPPWATTFKHRQSGKTEMIERFLSMHEMLNGTSGVKRVDYESVKSKSKPEDIVQRVFNNAAKNFIIIDSCSELK